jgi:hypothetical protein
MQGRHTWAVELVVVHELAGIVEVGRLQKAQQLPPLWAGTLLVVAKTFLPNQNSEKTHTQQSSKTQ